jgi:hypothetical protein
LSTIVNEVGNVLKASAENGDNKWPKFCM